MAGSRVFGDRRAIVSSSIQYLEPASLETASLVSRTVREEK